MEDAAFTIRARQAGGSDLSEIFFEGRFWWARHIIGPPKIGYREAQGQFLGDW
jgi:hypothetical protein